MTRTYYSYCKINSRIAEECRKKSRDELKLRNVAHASANIAFARGNKVSCIVEQEEYQKKLYDGDA